MFTSNTVILVTAVVLSISNGVLSVPLERRALTPVNQNVPAPQPAITCPGGVAPGGFACVNGNPNVINQCLATGTWLQVACQAGHTCVPSTTGHASCAAGKENKKARSWDDVLSALERRALTPVNQNVPPPQPAITCPGGVAPGGFACADGNPNVINQCLATGTWLQVACQAGHTCVPSTTGHASCAAGKENKKARSWDFDEDEFY